VTVTRKFHGHGFSVGQIVEVVKRLRDGYLCRDAKNETWALAPTEITLA
jgi:hypothetical protein